jgi:hypothetical protein
MFSWDFSAKKEHTASWYLIALGVVATLVIYGITQWLYLLSIVSFLFAWVYILMENNGKHEVKVQMTESVIRVADSVYEIKSFEKFSIITVNGTPLYLRLFPKKRFSPILDIPLHASVPLEEVREFLALSLEEDTTATLTNSDALIHAMRL